MAPAELFVTSLEDVKVVGELSNKPLLSESTPQDILTKGALKFIVMLHKAFNQRRKELLNNRQKVQEQLDSGKSLEFLKETEYIRNDPNWRCNPTHPKLMCRKVEITGPPDAKMIINAFNTDVQTYMTDFEDSCAPTWKNMIYGQVNLFDAIRDKIDFTNESTGKRYKINREGRRVPVMIVRPRGWHMVDHHILINNEPISASIMDFGLFFYHNAHFLIDQGLGPFFYLPKMEHWKEAQLWNDIFCVAQDCLEIPRGTIKATVLIETLPISYQLDEVLYALREHSSGLNCGRWDYMFSTIKRLRNQKDHILPDRQQVTMGVPFMTNYVKQLIKTCHKRGVHAMGGMAAFIPIKNDEKANSIALESVKNDKLREVLAGHDGTWIAHPGLLPTARSVFEEYMPTPNQLFVQKNETSISEEMLVDTNIENGKITMVGLNANIFIGLNYMESWLRGFGCVPINHLMEDAATAEVSRLQLWSWCKHQVKMDDTGLTITPEFVCDLIDKEVQKSSTVEGNKFEFAANALKDELTGKKPLAEFLTDILYPQITTKCEPIDLATLKA
ncbi:malate synthase [Martiniozyma asiatica (nom. inval.)]|nr:malate synthase [Martiniozyma asiatica]